MATSAYSKLSETEKEKRREYNRNWYRKQAAKNKASTAKPKLTAKAKAKQAKEKAREYQRNYKQKQATLENEMRALIFAIQRCAPTIEEARKIASNNLGFDVSSGQTLQYVMAKYVEFNDHRNEGKDDE